MGGNYYNARAFGQGFASINPDAAVQSQTSIAPTPGEIAYQKAAQRDPLMMVLLPQQVLDRVQTVRDAVQQLMVVEGAAVVTANAFIRQHNVGQVAAADYPKYDTFRHQVHNTQVAYHRALRKALYGSVGRFAGDQLMARVPWPTWLPSVRPETPRNVPAVQTGGGTNGLGVAQFVLIGGIILAVTAVVIADIYFIDALTSALSQAYVTWAQSRALEQILHDRRQVYDQCVAQGGTPAQCAAVVNQAFSTTEVTRFFANTAPGKGAIWYIGFAVVLLGVGAAGWWTYKTFYKPKSSMNGLGRVRRLASLNDATPSKYMLEVDA